MFPTFILNFDDIYLFQHELTSRGELINLKDIKETKYMCSFSKLLLLEQRLKSLDYFSLKFLGKSDYHYLTYLFLKKIKFSFVLVIIDKHEDLKQTFEGYISCGSWVIEALKLEFVKKIVFIKRNTDLKNFKKQVINSPIYVSIDKDIIDRNCFRTTWDQGDLSLDLFFEILEGLAAHDVIGVDVCGEPELNLAEIQKSEWINLKIWEIFTTSFINKRIA